MILTKVKMDKDVIGEFQRDLKKLEKMISSNEINMHRATKYRDFTVALTHMGGVGLQKRSELTEHLGGTHNPLSVTGQMLAKMKVMEAPGNAADAGYFGNDGEVPSIGRRKLTYTQLAILHHTGYKIPLQGDKGERVRKWFYACYGIKFKHSKEYLVVPPRPFMTKALNRYEEAGLDEKVTRDFINKKMGN
jgi:hypothetical protein